ncbi:ATP-binding protein, partial [Bacteriovoracales bacterium]|nr:ATP-binding protein [Bacteriovoracales bacterium]
SFYKKENGVWISEDMGDERKFSERKIKIRPFVFQVNTEKEQVYFVKINGGLNQINLTLVSQKQMLFKEGEDNQVYGIFFGIIISMVLYNVFILFSTKSYSYFFYVMYVFFYGLFLAGYQGFTQKYLFYNLPWFSNNGLSFTMGLSELSLTLFTISYLNIGSKNKKLFFFFKISVFGGLIVILSSLINPYAVNVKLFFLNAAVISFLAYGTAIYKWIKGYRPARYFTLAFSFMIIGSMITNMAVANILPNLAFFRQSIIFGTALQLIFLSMGLADRFNLIQEEAKKLQENYAKELEKEVTEKTKQVVMEKERAESSEKEVSGLLHNMRQSVFSVDNEGTIIPPVSEYSLELFGKPIVKESVFETLYKDLDKEGELFAQAQFVIGVSVNEDLYQYDAIGGGLPGKIYMKGDNEEEKSLKINYSPITDQEDMVTKIMMVVEDVTELENLERKAQESKEQSAKKITRLQEIVSNDKKGIQLFTKEANLNLQYAKESVEEKDLDRLFRAAHTVKGNSRIHNLRGLSSEVHVIENDIDNLRKSPDGKNVEKEALNTIYERLKVSVEEYLQLCKEIFGEDIDGSSSEIDLDDMIISKSLFMSSLEELKEISNEIGSEKISKILVKLEREEFKKYLGILHKTVDSISLSLSKNIELKIEGDDIYLDMTTASMIKDSLMHIIQNSADHGIQKEGVIKVVLKEVDGKMNISVSDDGAGIDAEVIYQKSVEKGLIKAGTSGELQPEDKLQLIFLPGFSTKDVATEFSGRGVGMDVVKTNIGTLEGSVQIQSTLGEGTTFNISIPLKS